MKKRFLPILLAAALLAATPAQAFASCAILKGITGFTPEAGYADTLTMTGLRSDETAITAVDDTWYGAEKIRLNFSGATSGTYYLVTISNADSGSDPFTPTSANVAGMDMFKATSANAKFTLYPNLTGNQTYYVYISTGSYTTSSNVETWTYSPAVKVASFTYGGGATLRTGDLNDDGNRDADDVRLVLSHITGSIATPLTALQKVKADTDNDGKITATDAYLICVEELN